MKDVKEKLKKGAEKVHKCWNCLDKEKKTAVKVGVACLGAGLLVGLFMGRRLK